MIRLSLLLLFTAPCFANNADLFKQALINGQQHLYQLNLNPNSTIDSFGLANQFESSVASNANAGNANSQTMFDKSYGENGDPNYLYNAGSQEIRECVTKSDPRCSTLNKYGDKDTQTQFQAYAEGFSSRYSIAVIPDPVDSACSTIKRKVPINSRTVSCDPGINLQTSCSSSINISLISQQCDPTNNGCSVYQNDPGCNLVQPYVPAKCVKYSYNANYGSCLVGTYSCNLPSNFKTPGCQDSGGREYQCGSCISGNDVGDHNGCWNQKCISSTEPQLAVYNCKAYAYDDTCARFK